MQGVVTELKDLKNDGFEVEMGLTEDGATIQATKVVELTDLSQLEGLIGKSV